MTHGIETDPPRNPAEWLLDDPDRATEGAERAIAEPLQRSPVTVLAHLSTVAKASLGRQIVNGFKQMLPGDLVDVFRAAWAEYRVLLDAGARTAGRPDAELVVALKDHKVTFDREPTFDLVVNRTTLLTVVGHLEIVVTLCQPEAVVRAGKLVKVRAGQTSVTGSVQLDDVPIVEKEYAWPYEFVIEFDPGVNLTALTSPWPTFQHR